MIPQQKFLNNKWIYNDEIFFNNNVINFYWLGNKRIKKLYGFLQFSSWIDLNYCWILFDFYFITFDGFTIF